MHGGAKMVQDERIIITDSAGNARITLTLGRGDVLCCNGRPVLLGEPIPEPKPEPVKVAVKPIVKKK